MVSEATRRSEEDSAAAGARFGVVSEERGGVVVLFLSGELDHDTAGPLRNVLAQQLRAGAGRIVVDCAGLRFCDSTGLNVLLHARLSARKRDGRVELAALRPAVARMFEITGTRSVFQVYAGVDEALADERPT